MAITLADPGGPIEATKETAATLKTATNPPTREQLLTEVALDVLTEPYTGEFQTGHYMYQWPDRAQESVSLMRVRARITDPAPGSTIGLGPCTVRGKAWSGTGPVTRVEVSLTGEGDWQPAQLEPSASGYHWQDWTFTWDTPTVGRHTLRARATDAAGNEQPDLPPWNRLGYGNNAIEVIFVDCR
jgi:hypothetical protein